MLHRVAFVLSLLGRIVPVPSIINYCPLITSVYRPALKNSSDPPLPDPPPPHSLTGNGSTREDKGPLVRRVGGGGALPRAWVAKISYFVNIPESSTPPARPGHAADGRVGGAQVHGHWGSRAPSRQSGHGGRRGESRRSFRRKTLLTVTALCLGINWNRNNTRSTATKTIIL